MRSHEKEDMSLGTVETGLLQVFNMIVDRNRDERLSPYVAAEYASKATRVANAIVNNRRQQLSEDEITTFNWPDMLEGLNTLFTSVFERSNDTKLSKENRSRFAKKAARVANAIVNARKQQLVEAGAMNDNLTDFNWYTVQKGLEEIYKGAIETATLEGQQGSIASIYAEKAANLSNSLVGVRKQRQAENGFVSELRSKKLRQANVRS